jgi:hypothetical protein
MSHTVNMFVCATVFTLYFFSSYLSLILSFPHTLSLIQILLPIPRLLSPCAVLDSLIVLLPFLWCLTIVHQLFS